MTGKEKAQQPRQRFRAMCSTQIENRTDLLMTPATDQRRAALAQQAAAGTAAAVTVLAPIIVPGCCTAARWAA